MGIVEPERLNKVEEADEWEELDTKYGGEIGEPVKMVMFDRRLPQEIRQIIQNNKKEYHNLKKRILYLRETANTNTHMDLAKKMLGHRSRVNTVQLKEVVVQNLGEEAGEDFQEHILNAVTRRKGTKGTKNKNTNDTNR